MSVPTIRTLCPVEIGTISTYLQAHMPKMNSSPVKILKRSWKVTGKFLESSWKVPGKSQAAGECCHHGGRLSKLFLHYSSSTNLRICTSFKSIYETFPFRTYSCRQHNAYPLMCEIVLLRTCEYSAILSYQAFFEL